ncbi:MAG: hypothetical protein A2857_06600 [Candidatus Levybacteria bacterium RIFCSPHIGHO2_01_FULL_36_15]|nr:MAG: hypothetical protein A2857_06600 [Candidatus Levybacteria bacterium RIFCSPHIGHO2_01_FULL_36_15]OGH38810.1 MAG: hypothetical protein A2905_02515 [Candidatus Levybacteria bacterium RIFCSPLOWO2_01_FULL_36_10]
MLSIDISEKFINITDIGKNYLGKYNFKLIKQIEIKEGEKWESKISELPKNEKVSLVVPDTEVFLYRFDVNPKLTGRLLIATILDKISKVIPAAPDDLAYDFEMKQTGLQSSCIIFIAITREKLSLYQKAFKTINITPELIVPESLVNFEVFKNDDPADQVILYLEVNEKILKFAFFDKYGPLLTLFEVLNPLTMEEIIKKSILFFKDKYGKNVDKIILGGDKVTITDSDKLGKIVNVPIIKSNQVFEKKVQELGINFNNQQQMLFIKALGVNLLLLQKEIPNLAKKSVLTFSDKSKGETAVPDMLLKNNIADEKRKDLAKETYSSENKKPENKRLIFLIFIFIISLILTSSAIASKFLVKQNTGTVPKIKAKSKVKSPSKKIIPSSTPPSLEKQSVKIEVLNGSGKAGSATVLSDYLKNKGYENIKTANAEDFSYKGITLQIKEDKKNYLESLINDLKDQYQISTASAFIDKDSDFDVILIVGG